MSWWDWLLHRAGKPILEMLFIVFVFSGIPSIFFPDHPLFLILLFPSTFYCFWELPADLPVLQFHFLSQLLSKTGSLNSKCWHLKWVHNPIRLTEGREIHISGFYFLAAEEDRRMSNSSQVLPGIAVQHIIGTTVSVLVMVSPFCPQRIRTFAVCWGITKLKKRENFVGLTW